MSTVATICTLYKYNIKTTYILKHFDLKEKLGSSEVGSHGKAMNSQALTCFKLSISTHIFKGPLLKLKTANVTEI